MKTFIVKETKEYFYLVKGNNEEEAYATFIKEVDYVDYITDETVNISIEEAK
jgi:hypothetical protein